MAGPYQDNTWTTGDYVTQTKMRQHITNEQYLRERSDFEEVSYGEASGEDTSTGTPNITVQLKIDGMVKGSASVTSGNGEFKLSNVDLSGVAYGLHAVQLVLTGGPGAAGPILRFVLRQDHVFATCWGTLVQQVSGGEGTTVRTLQMKHVSLITHRVAQLW